MSRIAAEILPGHRIDDVRDDAERWLGEKRIEAAGVGIGHGEHVRFVNPHPAANRGAVESQTFLECVGVPEIDWKRAVLPASKHVDEFQVDHVYLMFLGKGEKVVRCHSQTS